MAIPSKLHSLKVHKCYFLYKQIRSKVPIFYFDRPKCPSDNCYIVCLLKEKSALLASNPCWQPGLENLCLINFLFISVLNVQLFLSCSCYTTEQVWRVSRLRCVKHPIVRKTTLQFVSHVFTWSSDVLNWGCLLMEVFRAYGSFWNLARKFEFEFGIGI